ncbi:hypothetical protein J7L01_06435 [bacterium]|nr:hypothetical protein [bacterium]
MIAGVGPTSFLKLVGTAGRRHGRNRCARPALSVSLEKQIFSICRRAADATDRRVDNRIQLKILAGP